MYYYSARYYAPPTFISRDPLFEKYSSISPYAYCANNPVKNVDPTGEDWYQDSETGSVCWQKGNAATIDVDGATYNNIGETYTAHQGNTSITYEQNEAVSMTERVLNPNDFESQMKSDGSGKKDGDAGNCFVQAGKMVAKSGATSQDFPSYNINDKEDAFNYINSQIDNGVSLRAQVDRSGDGNGDHWVALSSRTTNLRTGEVSFGFYDPATRHSSKGINNTFNVSDFNLTGNPSYKPSLFYEVVNVRKNK